MIEAVPMAASRCKPAPAAFWDTVGPLAAGVKPLAATLDVGRRDTFSRNARQPAPRTYNPRAGVLNSDDEQGLATRILFTFAGGSSHLNPLVPIARACDAAGHVVAFSGRRWTLGFVEAAGFRGFAAGANREHLAPRQPLLELDVEREDHAFCERFVRVLAHERAPGLLALCCEWEPDLLVCDETDFGAMVVAERLAIPHATMVMTGTGSYLRPALVAGALDELRARHGLPPDRDLAMLRRYLVLTPFPPSYRDRATPVLDIEHAIRLTEPASLDANAPAPWLTAAELPVVHFTLGTVFNVRAGDLFERVVSGIRDLPINLVVTVGYDVDPAELGPQPPNVHVERYIPHATLLPRCSLIISHGGSGSIICALAHGLPQVLIPLGGDQPISAVRCAELGVARVIDPVTATPEAVRQAVTTVMSDRSYRHAAQRLGDEIAALPGPAHAVTLLERVAARGRPLLPA